MSENISSRKRLYLLDGFATLYRSHFAMIRNPLITTSGLHTSALFGFVNQTLSLLKQESPDYFVAVFDTDRKTFRHERYPEYKATRDRMPDELQSQLPYLWDILAAMNIPVLSKPGFEADDIIGTLANHSEDDGMDVFIVSGDKDFMQLVSDHVFLYSPGGRFKSTTIYDPAAVQEKWGLPPEKIIDLLGLMGDSSDNIPGVRGVGEKSAVKLIQEYGSLESVLENAENVSNKRVREGLLTGKEAATLSKELVTIDRNVDLEYSLADLAVADFNFPRLKELFTNLEFHAFLNQIDGFHQDTPTATSAPEKDYRTVSSLDDLFNLLVLLKKSKLISFDLETTSVDPMRADIVGLSFSVENDQGYYIPIIHDQKISTYFGDPELDAVIQSLKPVLENPDIQKTGQNVKYDCLILKRFGIDVTGVIFDTLIGAHLINPASRSLKLDSLALEYLNYHMVPIEDLIGRGSNQKSMADVPLDQISFYAAEDADVAFQLTTMIQKKLDEADLSRFMAEIELPLIPVLMEMEYNGTYVDQNILATMSAELGEDLERLRTRIIETAGQEFNINSTQQLANLLFDELGLPQIRKRSTAEEVLQQLKMLNPIPGLILDYRKINKLKNTYLDAFPGYVHPETGRIHSSFSQTVAATGRLSSSNPNFQNIPIRTDIGREIRKAFCAQKPAWKIFSADYSQIELRIMAHLSQDQGLIDAFQNNIDIHAQTASTVFNVPLEAVLPEMRRTAKIVNFGIMYGAGPFRMSQELGIPRKEAQALIDSYFEKYSGITAYIEKTIEQARENNFVQTILGRKRPVWDAASENRIQREAAIRMAINMPIQGTAAELIKLAMIAIHRELQNRKLQTKMILQIHDELLFEVPEDEIDVIQPLVIDKMENAMQLAVPLVVDCGIGHSWFEAH